jgi:hypothetical protein
VVLSVGAKRKRKTSDRGLLWCVCHTENRGLEAGVLMVPMDATQVVPKRKDADVGSEREKKCCGVEEENNKESMPSVERCMPQYLAKHVMPSTSSLFELVKVVRTATKEHARQDSHNGIEFGPDDFFETEVDHVPAVVVAVVVNCEPAEWLGIILEVW